MASQAIAAKGTLLEIETDTPGEFVTIAELKNIGPAYPSDELDASNHDSPLFREFVQGMHSNEIAIEGNLLPNNSTHNTNLNTGLLHFYNAGSFKLYRLVFPNNLATFYMNAFVRETNRSMNYDELLGFTATLRVSGITNFAISGAMMGYGEFGDVEFSE